MRKGKILFIIMYLIMIITTLSYSNNDPGTYSIRRFAFIVGSNNGGRELDQLKYTINDITGISDILSVIGGVKQEDKIILFNPDKRELKEGFYQVGQEINNKTKKNDKVEFLFYFSGHSDETSLLLNEEKYEYEQLEGDLSKIKSDIKMIILDSCHSGAFIQAKGGSFYPPFLTTYKTSGYVYLTSCTADENSYESDSIEYSLFTFSLLLGLRGAADANSDGNITLHELYQFVFNETLNQAEKITSRIQHPSYKIKLTGTGDVIITNIHQNTSRLIIKPEIKGNIIIKDSLKNIIVDIEKRNEKPLEIFLVPGGYFFSVYFNDKKYSKEFRIKANDIQEITSLKDMDRIDQNKNGVKGETADRISIHLTGAYAIPLSENLNTTVKNSVGCSMQVGFTILESGRLALNITAAGSCMYHPEIDSVSHVKSILIATGAVGGGMHLDLGSMRPFLNIAGGVSFSIVDSRFYNRTFVLTNPSVLGECGVEYRLSRLFTFIIKGSYLITGGPAALEDCLHGVSVGAGFGVRF